MTQHSTTAALTDRSVFTRALCSVGVAAAVAAFIGFGAGDASSSSSINEISGPVSAVAGKSDNLCVTEAWPPKSDGCLARLLGETEQLADVRVISSGVTEVTRAPMAGDGIMTAGDSAQGEIVTGSIAPVR